MLIPWRVTTQHEFNKKTEVDSLVPLKKAPTSKQLADKETASRLEIIYHFKDVVKPKG